MFFFLSVFDLHANRENKCAGWSVNDDFKFSFSPYFSFFLSRTLNFRNGSFIFHKISLVFFCPLDLVLKCLKILNFAKLAPKFVIMRQFHVKFGMLKSGTAVIRNARKKSRSKPIGQRNNIS